MNATQTLASISGQTALEAYENKAPYTLGSQTTHSEYKALLEINPLLWGGILKAAELYANGGCGTPDDWRGDFEWAVTDMTGGDDPLFWEERNPELWGAGTWSTEGCTGDDDCRCENGCEG